MQFEEIENERAKIYEKRIRIWLIKNKNHVNTKKVEEELLILQSLSKQKLLLPPDEDQIFLSYEELENLEIESERNDELISGVENCIEILTELTGVNVKLSR